MSALPRVAEIGVGITTLFAVFDSHDAITFAHEPLSTPSGDVRLIPVLEALTPLAGQPALAWVPGRQVADEVLGDAQLLLGGRRRMHPDPALQALNQQLQSSSAETMMSREKLAAMEAEQFLILTHAQVGEYMQRKASSRDRWLTGMRRLRDKIYGAA